MTSVYLAARYNRREEIVGYAEDLRARGYEVTSRWLLGMHEMAAPVRDIALALEGGKGSEAPPDAVTFAHDDVEDLTRADVMVAFTETEVFTYDEALAVVTNVTRRTQAEEIVAIQAFLNATAMKAARGGRHVEFGMALEAGKRIVLVGPTENIFHLLPGVERAATWDEALVLLEEDRQTNDGQAFDFTPEGTLIEPVPSDDRLTEARRYMSHVMSRADRGRAPRPVDVARWRRHSGLLGGSLAQLWERAFQLSRAPVSPDAPLDDTRSGEE